MPKLLHFEFEEAARQAAQSCADVIGAMVDGEFHDEDDINPAWARDLSKSLNGHIHGLVWKSRILRHRKGVAGEEKKTGADFILHYKFNSPKLSMSKGLLIQAKKSESGEKLSSSREKELRLQCKKMLEITPASFVSNYCAGGMRFGSALRVFGLTDTTLSEDLEMSPHTFFFQFFQCPIGDSRINSHHYLDLPNVTHIFMDVFKDG